MEATGLPSGTVYPALRRLERDALVESKWEPEEEASANQRPARRYYQVTREGKAAALAATQRYPLLARMAPEKTLMSHPPPSSLPRFDSLLLRGVGSLVPRASAPSGARVGGRASGMCVIAKVCAAMRLGVACIGANRAVSLLALAGQARAATSILPSVCFAMRCGCARTVGDGPAPEPRRFVWPRSSGFARSRS